MWPNRDDDNDSNDDDDTDETGLCFSDSLPFLCSPQNELLSGVQTRREVVDLAGHLPQTSLWRNCLLQKIMYLSVSVWQSTVLVV